MANETDSEANRLVMAFEGDSQSEAELVRALLEENGLFVFIENRNFPAVPYKALGISSPTPGCGVFVIGSDVLRAKEIIKEARKIGSKGDSVPVKIVNEKEVWFFICSFIMVFVLSMLFLSSIYTLLLALLFLPMWLTGKWFYSEMKPGGPNPA